MKNDLKPGGLVRNRLQCCGSYALLFSFGIFQSKIALIKEHQSKGINRYLWTAAKIVLAVLVIPPFLNYAALQKEMADLKPEGKKLSFAFTC